MVRMARQIDPHERARLAAEAEERRQLREARAKVAALEEASAERAARRIADGQGRARAALAAEAARCRAEAGARGQWVEVELYDRGERITFAGYVTLARPLYAIPGLSRGAREAGVLYGAMAEELSGSITSGSLSLEGRSGGESLQLRQLRGALRRSRMRAKIAAAHEAMRDLPGLTPKRRAVRSRAVEGEADLGPRRRARRAAGEMLERRPISTRALVDAVCVDGMSIVQVLSAHGWTQGGKVQSEAVSMLRDALNLVAVEWGGGEVTGRGGGIEARRADAGPMDLKGEWDVDRTGELRERK